MKTKTTIRATFIETIITSNATTTRQFEVHGDTDQIRSLLANARLVLPTPGAEMLPEANRPAVIAEPPRQEATQPAAKHAISPDDVYQAQLGGTVNEMRESERQQRLQRIWARNHCPPPTPMCGPSRQGILSQLSDILNAAY